MKKQQERSGVVRCQRCLKYGHYTYECENEVAYRYRPSRTVLYKQKIKLQLNQDKGPKTLIKDRDTKRLYVEDRPSSDSENEQEIELKKKLQGEKLQSSYKQEKRKQGLQQQQKGKEEKKSQQQSQSSSSDQSSSSSSSSDEDDSKDKGYQPRKMKKTN